MKKIQKDKQRSTKHTHKTKDRKTQTPLIKGYIFLTFETDQFLFLAM